MINKHFKSFSHLYSPQKGKLKLLWGPGSSEQVNTLAASLSLGSGIQDNLAASGSGALSWWTAFTFTDDWGDWQNSQSMVYGYDPSQQSVKARSVPFFCAGERSKRKLPRVSSPWTGIARMDLTPSSVPRDKPAAFTTDQGLMDKLQAVTVCLCSYLRLSGREY